MITVQSNNVATASPAQSGVQFLSPKHIPENGILALKVTRVTTDKPDNFGNPYVVYFSGQGGKYSKGYKPTSEATAVFAGVWGNDETKWIGQSVNVGKSTDEDGGVRLTYVPVAMQKSNGKK